MVGSDDLKRMNEGGDVVGGDDFVVVIGWQFWFLVLLLCCYAFMVLFFELLFLTFFLGSVGRAQRNRRRSTKERMCTQKTLLCWVFATIFLGGACLPLKIVICF